jgi:hypothetical protein
MSRQDRLCDAKAIPFEYGSISTRIFLTAALGALRRPTVFILMKAAAWNFA